MVDEEMQQPIGDITQEIRYARARIHKLTDQLQVANVLITELRIKLASLETDMIAFKAEAATREQLKNAIETLTSKITNLSDDLDPIKKGITWAVSLTLGAVIIALLSLVIRSTRGGP